MWGSYSCIDAAICSWHVYALHMSPALHRGSAYSAWMQCVWTPLLMAVLCYSISNPVTHNRNRQRNNVQLLLGTANVLSDLSVYYTPRWRKAWNKVNAIQICIFTWHMKTQYSPNVYTTCTQLLHYFGFCTIHDWIWTDYIYLTTSGVMNVRMLQCAKDANWLRQKLQIYIQLVVRLGLTLCNHSTIANRSRWLKKPWGSRHNEHHDGCLELPPPAPPPPQQRLQTFQQHVYIVKLAAYQSSKHYS